MLEEKSCKIYIKELTEQKPIVTMAVVAWHFETKSMMVTYTDANGQTAYRTETFVERVNDHEEVEQFPYIRWEDLSPDPQLLSLDPGKVTRIKLLTTVLFGDTETEEEFNRIRTELEENAQELYPSSNVEFTRWDAIPGLEERVCAYWESDEAKWWINIWVYVIMSLLLLTWFYRIAFTFVTQSTCFRVVKKVYTSWWLSTISRIINWTHQAKMCFIARLWNTDENADQDNLRARIATQFLFRGQYRRLGRQLCQVYFCFPSGMLYTLKENNLLPLGEHILSFILEPFLFWKRIVSKRKEFDLFRRANSF